MKTYRPYVADLVIRPYDHEGPEHRVTSKVFARCELEARRMVIGRALRTGFAVSYFTSVDVKGGFV